MKTKTLSIGIPAYNEGGNIHNLLKKLLSQEECGFSILEIIVVSDKSSDDTTSKVLGFKDKRIKLVENTTRLGNAQTLNKILRIAKGDMIALFDADTLPDNNKAVYELVKPLLADDNNVGLTSGSSLPFPENKFIQKSIRVTIDAYRELRLQINAGNNIYSCIGRSMSLSKKFAKSIEIPKEVFASDAYIYFDCIKKGYNFVYTGNSKVSYFLPTNYKDQIKQNRRFEGSFENIKPFFGQDMLDKELFIPKGLVFKYLLGSALRHPILASSIFAVNLYSKLNKNNLKRSSIYETIDSTKKATIVDMDNTKSKRIDIVVKYFYPVAAGIETSILQTYSRLAKRGWDIHVHTSTGTLNGQETLSYYEEFESIKIHRYDWKFWSFYPKIDWTKTNAVSLHNFDILPHLYIFLITLWLKLINKKHHVLLVTPHGGYNPIWTAFSPLTSKIKKFYHLVIGVILLNSSADSVRAVSEWERLEIIKCGVRDNLVTTIINGTEDEAILDIDKLASRKIKDQVKSFGKYIIQIGRIQEIKNFETMIKAMPFIPKDINFVIVGPEGLHPDYPKYLHRLSKELGVENRIKFYGIVRGVDKYYLIKHAQMMVHMAIWESYCMAVHEAMSQGLVCLVANNTALPLLIKDKINGYLIDTYDYKQLATKINYVLSNKNKMDIKNMQAANIKYTINNTWENLSFKIESLYTHLIAHVNSNNNTNQLKNKLAVTKLNNL